MKTSFSSPWGLCSSPKASWWHKWPLLLDSRKESISFQRRGFIGFLKGIKMISLKDASPPSLWFAKRATASKRGFNHSIQKKNKTLPLAGFEPRLTKWQAEMITITPCHSPSSYQFIAISYVLSKNFRI